MKKILDLLKKVAIAFAVLIAIAMVFGGGSGDKGSDSGAKKKEEAAVEQEAGSAEEEATEQESVPEEEPQAEEGPSIATDADYSVTIDSYSLTNDYDGAPCIAINYTFTNVSDSDATSMQMATNITVYQNGVECEDAWFADDNSDGYTNKVKAGVSVAVTRVYKLQDTTSDVEVEVAPLFSWSDDLLAYQVIKIA